MSGVDGRATHPTFRCLRSCNACCLLGTIRAAIAVVHAPPLSAACRMLPGPSPPPGYPRWWTLTGGPGAMARAAHPAAAPERTCQAPWYCHRLSGRHSGDPERPAA